MPHRRLLVALTLAVLASRELFAQEAGAPAASKTGLVVSTSAPASDVASNAAPPSELGLPLQAARAQHENPKTRASFIGGTP